ncbi:glycosyltransferase family 4 protein [Candidatus Parcubacteria bacterium]|nr:glycosyltransferase family 4 protein [Candidatus Parcubacteria bacterium]
MSKQKLVLVITKGNWGGAQKYVYEMATNIDASRFEVSVVHGWGDILPKKLNESQVRTTRVPGLGRDVNILKDISVFFSLFKFFRKERPDIVHLNSSKIGGIGALAARLAGVRKIFFTVHGFAFNEDRPWWQRKIIGFLSWFSIILTTHVICISKQEYERAAQWPFLQSKLHLIYNGIVTPHFLPKEEARTTLSSILNTSGFFKDTFVVGTIGELTKNKGYVYALEAIKNIPHVKYLIIGGGDQKNELKKYIADHNLSDKVILAGFLKDASSFLRAFDLFLLPSLKEGMPYVILEAGLAEIPVVTTSVGGITEMIDDTGYVIAPRDSQAIQSAILKVMTDHTMATTKSTELRERIERLFTVDNMLKQTMKLYDNTV